MSFKKQKLTSYWQPPQHVSFQTTGETRLPPTPVSRSLRIEAAAMAAAAEEGERQTSWVVSVFGFPRPHRGGLRFLLFLLCGFLVSKGQQDKTFRQKLGGFGALGFFGGLLMLAAIASRSGCKPSMCWKCHKEAVNNTNTTAKKTSKSSRNHPKVCSLKPLETSYEPLETTNH